MSAVIQAAVDAINRTEPGPLTKYSAEELATRIVETISPLIAMHERKQVALCLGIDMHYLNSVMERMAAENDG